MPSNHEQALEEESENRPYKVGPTDHESADAQLVNDVDLEATHVRSLLSLSLVDAIFVATKGRQSHVQELTEVRNLGIVQHLSKVLADRWEIRLC